MKEEDKDSIRKKRDAAFSGTIDIDVDDKIREMFSHNGRLHLVTLKRIVRMNTPDDIDPKLQFADAPVTHDIVLEFGSRNPIVAQTILQTRDALPFMGNHAEQTRVLSIAWDVMQHLIQYEKTVASLKHDVDTLGDTIASNIEKYTTGNNPRSLPQVADLDFRFRAAVHSIHQALNSISDLFPAAFREEFRRGRYDKIIEWSKKKFGDDDILTAMLQGDHRWINVWGEIRNAIEHPKPGFRLKVNNFLLMASRQVQLPTWQLEHPTLDMNRPQEMLQQLATNRNNVLGFFENLILLLIEKTTNSGFAVGYRDLGEHERNPERPTRYEFFPVQRKNSD